MLRNIGSVDPTAEPVRIQVPQKNSRRRRGRRRRGEVGVRGREGGRDNGQLAQAPAFCLAPSPPTYPKPQPTSCSYKAIY